MDNTPIKPPDTSTAALKPINKGVGKGSKKKSPAQKHARRTPNIATMPGLSREQKLLLQKHIIEPIYYRDSVGNHQPVSSMRKIYFFSRLIGVNHSKSLVNAGYNRYRTLKDMMGEGRSTTALKTYWNTNGLNLEYILDRLCTLVEKGQNENSRVRALKLLSELKGYYTTRSVVDINEHLQVNFSMSGPVLCPHCGANTLHPPPPGQQLAPGTIQPADPVLIEGEYTTN